MRFWNKGLSSLLLLSFVTVGITGCGKQALPGRTETDRGGHIQSSDSSPVSDKQMKDAQSNGILAANQLALRLNKMPGVQNATVLVLNDDAFVGLTNIGTERKPDAQIKQDSWRGESPWGTQTAPKSAAGMTVEELQTEGIRGNAATLDGPRSSITGNVADDLKGKISATIKRSLPQVQNVHITGVLSDAQRLSGYKHFITNGGDMAAHMNEFLTFIGHTF
ncbi:hypothetical protein [Tumebacillus lipolyticus]|uniref:Uncharacterized protein n=1 Tax=Tumebacillus lipolyticus TaxID=1280370 RepID=A0ABW4ZU33_9BACL